jgi:RimJ/RimL family protein N-acetyltransferase
LRGQRVAVRLWRSQDDPVQRSWPGYTEPFSELWNIPRSTPLYDGLLSFGSSSFTRRVWAIDDLEGHLIGRISLRDIDQRKGRSRLGISLAPSHVGRGLGTEALELFLTYYFNELHFTVMVLDVAAFNRRAVHCYERMGFREIDSEWRKSSFDSSTHLLDNQLYQHLRPFFRRERFGVWVLFLEMELQRDAWYKRDAADDWASLH